MNEISNVEGIKSRPNGLLGYHGVIRTSSRTLVDCSRLISLVWVTFCPTLLIHTLFVWNSAIGAQFKDLFQLIEEPEHLTQLYFFFAFYTCFLFASGVLTWWLIATSQLRFQQRGRAVANLASLLPFLPPLLALHGILSLIQSCSKMQSMLITFVAVGFAVTSIF